VERLRHDDGGCERALVRHARTAPRVAGEPARGLPRPRRAGAGERPLRLRLRLRNRRSPAGLPPARGLDAWAGPGRAPGGRRLPRARDRSRLRGGGLPAVPVPRAREPPPRGAGHALVVRVLALAGFATVASLAAAAPPLAPVAKVRVGIQSGLVVPAYGSLWS